MSGQRVVPTGVSLDLAEPPLAPMAMPLRGPLIALYGKNGAGKSRLLNGIAYAAGAPEAQPTRFALHVELVGDEPAGGAIDLHGEGSAPPDPLVRAIAT